MLIRHLPWHTFRHRRSKCQSSTYSYHRRIALWGFLFALPAAAYLVLFSIYPMFNAFYLSLTKYDLLSPPEFIGLANYGRLLTDQKLPAFPTSNALSMYLARSFPSGFCH